MGLATLAKDGMQSKGKVKSSRLSGSGYPRTSHWRFSFADRIVPTRSESASQPVPSQITSLIQVSMPIHAIRANMSQHDSPHCLETCLNLCGIHFFTTHRADSALHYWAAGAGYSHQIRVESALNWCSGNHFFTSYRADSALQYWLAVGAGCHLYLEWKLL